MKMKNIFISVVVLAFSPALYAQDPNQPSVSSVGQNNKSGFENAAGEIQKKLEDSVAELNKLRQQVAEEKVPLSRKLSDLESELIKVRLDYQKTTRLLDSRTLDLSNLRSEIKSRQQEASYLSDLLGEYIRNFESRLHIVELQRYQEPLEAAKLAPENSNLAEEDIYKTQAGLLSVSLDRLNDALNGTRFDGTATDSSGSIHHGTFVLIGPSAVFRSDDGKNTGTAEQRLGSLAPTIIPFGNEADTAAVNKLISDSIGSFPLDPTLGNAHKIAQTKETLLEHIKKGGPVMYPIFILAGAALLVAICKWLSMAFLRKPSQKRIHNFLEVVAKHDEQAVREEVKKIRGPVGEMLAAGVEHLSEPRELVEEIMYEKVLATRLRLQSFLPFVALSASSAPLLGLLGTVTGIINTFKLITVYGSGDVKTLSSGISEALITTEFGLYVAIPSLLMYAFLSRKARGVIDLMEKTATAFINQISKTPYFQNNEPDTLAKPIDELSENSTGSTNSRMKILDLVSERRYPEDSAGAIMNPRVISVDKTDTVAQAIDKIRTAQIGEEVNAIFVVDEKGKYAGHVLIRQLLTRPDNASIESLADVKPIFVRIDTHKDKCKDLFSKYDLASIPVLDHNDILVGQLIRRNGNGY